MRSARVVVYAFATVYAAICLATMPDGPFTSPDSTAYLDMQPIVPLGYPLVLRIFGAPATVVLQPLIFSAAVAWLGLQTLRVSQRASVALAVMVGIVATPGLRDYHVSILSESLFASGLIAFLAAIAGVAAEPTWKRVVAAAVIAGLTVTIRRAAYAFLPVLILTVVMQRRRLPGRWTSTLTAAVLPAMVIVGIESIGARVVHGNEATSLTGRHLFAKAALLDARRDDAAVRAYPWEARIHHALDVEFAPIRALIARAPRAIAASLVVYYETCLQGPCVASLRGSLDGLSEREKNAALARAAAARIASSPIAFLELTAMHYASLWTAYKLRHPDTASVMTAFLADHRPLPFEREAFKVSPDQPLSFAGSTMVRIVQPAVILVGLVTGGLAFCGIAGVVHARLSPLGAAATLSAITAHGCLLFSAIAAAGISRFMVGAFPAVVTALILGAWWAAQALQHRGLQRSRYH